MIDRHPARTTIQMEEELDEIFRLQVAGATPRQIQKIRNLPERTYYDYNQRLQERIVSSLTAARTEEILVQKELCKERIVDYMRVEHELAHNDKISPRTRMDAAQRGAEQAMALFKLEVETTNWLVAYRNLQLEAPKKIELTGTDSLADARSSTNEENTNE